MVDSQQGAISNELAINFLSSIRVSGIIVLLKLPRKQTKLKWIKNKNDPKGYAYSYGHHVCRAYLRHGSVYIYIKGFSLVY